MDDLIYEDFPVRGAQGIFVGLIGIRFRDGDSGKRHRFAVLVLQDSLEGGKVLFSSYRGNRYHTGQDSDKSLEVHTTNNSNTSLTTMKASGLILYDKKVYLTRSGLALMKFSQLDDDFTPAKGLEVE